MKIALVAATKAEIEPTLLYLTERLYLRKHQQIEVILTGVGSIATTYCLTRHFLKFRPNLAIQAGIGGSFHPLFCPGKIVTIKEEIIGDLGVMQYEKWHSLFDLGFLQEDEHPWSEGKLVNPNKELLCKPALEKVRAVTVNQISTDAGFIQQLKDRFMPVVESMEGAAFHYVCLKESIPFLQLRAISNMVGERDKSKWKLNESVTVLNEHLIQLINNLTDPY